MYFIWRGITTYQWLIEKKLKKSKNKIIHLGNQQIEMPKIKTQSNI